jgi:TRAP-type C4-dicarboxylate transport system permease small subunit
LFPIHQGLAPCFKKQVAVWSTGLPLAHSLWYVIILSKTCVLVNSFFAPKHVLQPFCLLHFCCCDITYNKGKHMQKTNQKMPIKPKTAKLLTIMACVQTVVVCILLAVLSYSPIMANHWFVVVLLCLFCLFFVFCLATAIVSNLLFLRLIKQPNSTTGLKAFYVANTINFALYIPIIGLMINIFSHL